MEKSVSLCNLSTQGKVLRDKDSAEKGLKQRVLGGIKQASQSLRGHADRASRLVRRWWKGRSSSGSSMAGEGEL